MSVANFLLTSFPTQDPATYKSAIDGDFMVTKRLVDAFAPHAQATPNLTVALDPGFTFYGATLTEVAAQNSAAVAASSRAGITRIDRVVADIITGAVAVVAGTSLAPAIPSGKMPVAQVALTTASTAITNAMLTDERAFPANSRAADYQQFDSTLGGTWAAPLGFSSNADVYGIVWGGGGGGSSGGGGGAAALVFQTKLGSLSTAVAVTVGIAGTSGGGTGGNSAFGSWTAYGGASAASNGGGGGGVFGAGSAGAGGSPIGGAAGNPGVASNFGGAGGGNANGSTGGASVHGGGGGGSPGSGGTLGGAGGAAIYGGGGGGGNSTAGAGAGGVSVVGGNGGAGSTVTGAVGTAGSVPGGGGGSQASGGHGRVSVWVFP